MSISEIQNRKNKLVSCAECTQKISNYRREWLNTFIDDVFLTPAQVLHINKCIQTCNCSVKYESSKNIVELLPFNISCLVLCTISTQ